MSAPINDGGPAFPVADSYRVDGQVYNHNGMTLRDWFAGQAMASILISKNFTQASTKEITERAYWYADAMLDERMEEPK